MGAPQSLTVTVQHNALSTATLVLDADHDRAGDLSAPGARLVITYHGQHLLSGPCRRVDGRGPRDTSTLTFAVEDDWRVLSTILGWQNPTQAAPGQGAGGVTYATYTGPAETVVKQIARANLVGRTGLPLTIAPDLGRGQQVTVAVRMDRLADKLFPAVDDAGVGVTVRQASTTGKHGGGLVLDCYTPRSYRRELSEDSGVIVDWASSAAAPTVTRAVVGGVSITDDDAGVDYVQVVDSALEAVWGTVAEAFIDGASEGSDYTSAYRDMTSKQDAVTRAQESWATAKDKDDAARRDLVSAQVALQIAQNALAGDTGNTSKQQAVTSAQSKVTSAVNDVADADAALARETGDLDAANTALRGAQDTVGVTRAAYLVALAQRGTDAITAGAAKYGLSVTLSETSSFRYGRTATGGGLQVGDHVRMRVAADAVYEDVLRSATLSWTRDQGVVITPTVGERTDDPSTVLGRAIAALDRSVRVLRTRR